MGFLNGGGWGDGGGFGMKPGQGFGTSDFGIGSNNAFSVAPEAPMQAGDLGKSISAPSSMSMGDVGRGAAQAGNFLVNSGLVDPNSVIGKGVGIGSQIASGDFGGAIGSTVGLFTGGAKKNKAAAGELAKQGEMNMMNSLGAKARSARGALV